MPKGFYATSKLEVLERWRDEKTPEQPSPAQRSRSCAGGGRTHGTLYQAGRPFNKALAIEGKKWIPEQFASRIESLGVQRNQPYPVPDRRIAWNPSVPAG